MISLSGEAIKSFQNLYLQEYGTMLIDEVATQYAIRLIMFVRAVYGEDIPSSEDVDLAINKANNNDVLN